MEQEKEWIAYVNGEYIPHVGQRCLELGRHNPDNIGIKFGLDIFTNRISSPYMYITLHNSDFRSTRGLNTILKYIKSTKGAECGYAFGEGFAKDYILMVANTRVPSNTHHGLF